MASSGREQLNGEYDKATLLKPGMEQKTLTVSFELSNRSQTSLDPAALCAQKGCGGCTHFCGQLAYGLMDDNFGVGPSHVVNVEGDGPVMCKLCLSDYALSNLYRLSVCRCLFCLECMQQYVQVLVTEGTTTITCPDASCPISGTLTEHEVQNLTSVTTFTRYKKLKFERDVELDPQRTFCPQPGCETVCSVPQSDEAIGDASNATSQRVDCPTCGHHFCAKCKSKWHGDLTCDEVMRTGRHEDEGIPFDAAVDAPIKRCPVCHLPIERNDGCAQMMCKRCKHVFCWYCMASLDNDFLLRHYDKGPCKNRLGHSRASVIWHRTQVIGIFAGFGLLLLVASPFLLLAAPCILCCKCKRCRCHDDDDDTADGANSQT